MKFEAFDEKYSSFEWMSDLLENLPFAASDSAEVKVPKTDMQETETFQIGLHSLNTPVGIQLGWNANLTGATEFEVQKWDGQSFVAISRIVPTSVTINQQLVFEDNRPQHGPNLYRIQLMSETGVLGFSTIAVTNSFSMESEMPFAFKAQQLESKSIVLSSAYHAGEQVKVFVIRKGTVQKQLIVNFDEKGIGIINSEEIVQENCEFAIADNKLRQVVKCK
ncbi:MAG: hypothetical protein IT244_00030 [Bacteroidia bacterium]|nr:hypothetical protein [Bacteroidia bacterium]